MIEKILQKQVNKIQKKRQFGVNDTYEQVKL